MNTPQLKKFQRLNNIANSIIQQPNMHNGDGEYLQTCAMLLRLLTNVHGYGNSTQELMDENCPACVLAAKLEDMEIK